jgi:hypothetical protein
MVSLATSWAASTDYAHGNSPRCVHACVDLCLRLCQESAARCAAVVDDVVMTQVPMASGNRHSTLDPPWHLCCCDFQGVDGG